MPTNGEHPPSTCPLICLLLHLTAGQLMDGPSGAPSPGSGLGSDPLCLAYRSGPFKTMLELLAGLPQWLLPSKSGLRPRTLTSQGQSPQKALEPTEFQCKSLGLGRMKRLDPVGQGSAKDGNAYTIPTLWHLKDQQDTGLQQDSGREGGLCFHHICVRSNGKTNCSRQGPQSHVCPTWQVHRVTLGTGRGDGRKG